MKEPRGYQDLCSNIVFSSPTDVILNGFRGRKTHLTIRRDNNTMTGKNIKAGLDFYLDIEDLRSFTNHAQARGGTIEIENCELDLPIRMEATFYITKDNLKKIQKYANVIVDEPIHHDLYVLQQYSC